MFPRVEERPVPPSRFKLKVCLLGDQMVGKTSLTRRFAHNEFSDRYVETLGTVVSRKALTLPGKPDPMEVNLMVWDIVGRKSMADLLGEAYFTGSHGSFFVFDLTRPETLENLWSWWEVLKREAPNIPSMVLANKSDLKELTPRIRDRLEELSRASGAPFRLTSAKTGQGVEEAFSELARGIIARDPQAA